MSEEASNSLPELPNFIALLAEKFHGTPFGNFLHHGENVLFSLLVIGFIMGILHYGFRKPTPIPGRLQNALEVVFGGIDDFVCGLLGPKGRQFTPFIGTLFIYILVMNIAGLIPFLKSPTSSWSTTLALALCVFVYVQYTALKELGFWGYLDHLMAQPRGAMAWSLIMPFMMLVMHLIAELVRPISLSLRLRTNIWGDDLLISVMTGFGLTGWPMLFVITSLAVLTAVVQAVVFTLLTTVYLALVMKHEEDH